MGAMFDDVKRRHLHLDLLADEEGLVCGLHDTTTAGATGRDMIEHLGGREQEAFVLGMPRLSSWGALFGAVGRWRFGRLNNVGRRWLGGGRRVLLGLGELFLEKTDLLLQLTALDLQGFQLLPQLRTTSTKLFGLLAHVSLS